MVARNAINAAGRPLGPYSAAVFAGGFLLLSGRVGLADDVLADGVEAQTAAAIGNAAAVLAEAGLMLGDYFFLSEHEAMGLVREPERLAIGIYAVTTTLCVLLIENLHVRIQRTEHAVNHARHHHHKSSGDSTADSAYSH